MKAARIQYQMKIKILTMPGVMITIANGTKRFNKNKTAASNSTHLIIGTIYPVYCKAFKNNPADSGISGYGKKDK